VTAAFQNRLNLFKPVNTCLPFLLGLNISEPNLFNQKQTSMRKLYALLAALSLTLSLTGQTARVQVIHNSPSPTVDVYANGALLLDDFVFRTATPFVDLPAGIEIDLAVAPGNSTSVNDAIATFENIVLDETKTYVIAAGGIVGDNDFPFTLQVTDAGLEASGNDLVQVNVLHGSPGAPNVDVAVCAVAATW
jgi:hypothetical protein